MKQPSLPSRPKPKLKIRPPRRARRRLGLGAKLMGVNAAILAIAAVMTLVSLDGVGTVSDASDQLYAGSMVPLKDLAQARAQFNLDRALADEHIIETNPVVKKTLADRIHANEAAITAAVGRIKASASGQDAQDVLDTMDNDLRQYGASRASMLELSDAFKIEEAFTTSVNETTPIGNAITDDFDKLFDLKARQGKAAAAAARRTADRVRATVFALLLGALGLGAVLSLLVVRGVRRTVADVLDRLASLRERDTTDLRGGLSAMERGDLTVAVTPGTARIERLPGDELGQIARAVNDVRDNTAASVESYNSSRRSLAGMLGEVGEAACDVSGAAGVMAQTSNEAGRAVQRDLARRWSTSSRAPSARCRPSAPARDRIEQVAEISTRGRPARRRPRTPPARRAASRRRARPRCRRRPRRWPPSARPRRRGHRDDPRPRREVRPRSAASSTTITGIAEQTNLLALNAAIEAARAASRAAASRSSPTRCASWPRSPRRRPARSPR